MHLVVYFSCIVGLVHMQLIGAQTFGGIQL